jgi:hypothetical protein
MSGFGEAGDGAAPALSFSTMARRVIAEGVENAVDPGSLSQHRFVSLRETAAKAGVCDSFHTHV